MSPPARIFISYARRDEAHVQDLSRHLAPLLHRGLVAIAWSDRELRGGEDYEREITKAIAGADLALLLLSPDFFHSEFIRTRELPMLLERQEAGGLEILPVLVERCLYQGTAAARFQCIPRNDRFIADQTDRNAAWVEVAEAVETLVSRAAQPAPAPPAVSGEAPSPEPPAKPRPELGPGSLLDGGRFQLAERIGEGTFGTVWKAWDDHEDRTVAIKVLHRGWGGEDSEMGKLFFRGARRMARLRHPRIVEVFRERILEGGWCCFAMRYLPGGDLHRAVMAGTLSPAEAYEKVLLVAEAVQHAHEKGLLHRDIKPHNILLSAEGEPLLTDFDLGMAVGQQRPDHGQRMGTAVYAAPEMMEDASRATYAADVYGLAMTAAFCLHGRDIGPAEADDLPSFVAGIHASAPMKSALIRALDPNPKRRFQSVKELLTALRVPEPATATPMASVAPQRPAVAPAPSSPGRDGRFKTGDVIAKKYEIVRYLGEGWTAQTYLARHIASGKELVVKLLHPYLVGSPRHRERLKQLFERARSVRHDCLTRYGELGMHGDEIYYTEEYFPSESLRDVVDAYVAEGKAFSLQEACQLLISILEAAEVGHNAGFIHRNLKPESVLVHTRRIGPAANAKVIRSVKVTGMGMAAVLNPTAFTEAFVSREEAPYLAPELSSFDQDCGPQADIYSVGIMLYELLCGQRPMGTYLSPTQLREDLPEHVDDISEIALAHNPEDRYPTARDMINDIQRSFSLEMQRGHPMVSFRNIIIALTLAAALTGLALGIWTLLR